MELISLRLLNSLMFLGSIILLFYITKDSFGLLPARFVSLVLASSAGFVAYSHILLYDMPVVFMMLLTLFFVLKILKTDKLTSYLIAGFVVGLTTATKYNGVIMFVSIVLVFLLNNIKALSFKKLVLNKKIYSAFTMMLLGFSIGNPYAILDYPTFINDFQYTYYISQNWSVKSGTSFMRFFTSIWELIGVFSFLLVVIGFGFAIVELLRRYIKGRDLFISYSDKLLIVLITTSAIYFLILGKNSYISDRWVMPIVPILLLISCSLITKIFESKKILIFIILIIFPYNFYCSYLVGYRFLSDPRMDFQIWARNNIPNGTKVLRTKHSPNLNLLNGINVVEVKMPYLYGSYARAHKYSELDKGNDYLAKRVSKANKSIERIRKWYNIGKIYRINPDFILLNSIDLSKYLYSDFGKQNPQVADFIQSLISEKYNYNIVFDQKWATVSKWIYPKKVGWVINRFIVLKSVPDSKRAYY